VGQQPNWVLGPLIVEFSRIHRHTTFGTTPLDEGSARLKYCYLHNRRTSIPSAGLEPAMPAIKPLQNYVLDDTATAIGLFAINYV